MIASGSATASSRPPCSTAIRWASPITTSMWCSTMRTVFPSSAWTDLISSTSSGTSSIETPAIGSSSRSTRLSAARSIASSSLRLSPCDSSPAAHHSRSVSPTRSIAQVARATASRTAVARRQILIVPPIAASADRRTFSCADSSGKTFETWNVRPIPAFARRYGGCSVMSTPSSSMVPLVGRRRPETRLKSVVFPAPFGPITARSSPSRTSSSTSATIVAPPMSSPRFLVARIGDVLTRYLASASALGPQPFIGTIGRRRVERRRGTGDDRGEAAVLASPA